jgi:PAS domain S-box-containing protein
MPRNNILTKENLINESLEAEIRAESDVIFSCIGDGAITTDEFGHITRINPVALSILGMREVEVLDKWFPKIMIAVKSDNTPVSLIDRPIFKMFLTGKPVSEKMHYRVKAGRIVPVNTTVSPIIVDGKPVGAIEVFRDITVENEIDKMKSEFISIASHQLRTPLSTIKTYAHMLIEGYMGKVNKDQTNALKTITKASNSMNELIATLLNIARIESGGIKVSRKNCDAGQLVDDVIKELTLVAKEKTIKITLRIPKRSVSIKTDGLIIKEVLANLIGNAIKYTPRNGSINVSVQNQRDKVLFIVEDTGLGIPLQSQDKIFRKFFRAQNVLQKETTGTGLGLYVVRGLVLALHGKIWFKSEENTGSSFYVSLPKKVLRKTNAV